MGFIKFKCGCKCLEIDDDLNHKVIMIHPCTNCLDSDELTFTPIERTYFKPGEITSIPWAEALPMVLEIGKLIGEGYDLRRVQYIMHSGINKYDREPEDK